MTAIGREDLIDNPDYFPVANMMKNNLSPSMYDMIMAVFKTKDAAEWKEILTKLDIPFSVAQNWEEILNDEQAWANDCLYKMKYDNGNERTLVVLTSQIRKHGNT